MCEADEPQCLCCCSGSVLPDDSTPAPPEPPAKAPRMAPSFDTGKLSTVNTCSSDVLYCSTPDSISSNNSGAC